jgi:hypothetical protein
VHFVEPLYQRMRSHTGSATSPAHQALLQVIRERDESKCEEDGEDARRKPQAYEREASLLLTVEARGGCK